MKKVLTGMILILALVMCPFISGAEKQQVVVDGQGGQIIITEDDVELSSDEIEVGQSKPSIYIEGIDGVSFSTALAEGETTKTIGEKHLIISFGQAGSITVPFKVTADLAECAVGAKVIYWQYTGKRIEPVVYVKTINTTTSLREGVDYKVEYPKYATSIGSKKGRIVSNSEYLKGNARTFEYEIDKARVKKSWIKLSNYTYAYDGNVHKPKVTLTNAAGVKLVEGKDYYVKYPQNDKYAGTKFVDVFGKGNYESSFTVTYAVTPKKIGISKITYGSRSVKIYMSNCKGSGTDIYQIFYRVKGTSTWKSTSTGYTYKTLKNLKKGEKYEIKVRSMAHTYNKEYYYSAYSSIKTTSKIK